MDKRQETTNRHMDTRQQTDICTRVNKQTDIWTAKQTAKGTQGVYFGITDKPYFDP